MRLALADRAGDAGAGELVDGQRSAFEEEKEEEPPEAADPPPAPPRPEWTGPPPDLLWQGHTPPKRLQHRGGVYRGFHPGPQRLSG